MDSLWNGTAPYTGPDLMVHSAGWNGSPRPGQSTAFGHTVRGPGGHGTTGLACQLC